MESYVFERFGSLRDHLFVAAKACEIELPFRVHLKNLREVKEAPLHIQQAYKGDPQLQA